MSQHAEFYLPAPSDSTPRRTMPLAIRDRLRAWIFARDLRPFVVMTACSRAVVDLCAPDSILAPVETPAAANLLVVAGPVNARLAPRIAWLHRQIPGDAPVLALCACARAGLAAYLDVDEAIPDCPVQLAEIHRALDNIARLRMTRRR